MKKSLSFPNIQVSTYLCQRSKTCLMAYNKKNKKMLGSSQLTTTRLDLGCSTSLELKSVNLDLVDHKFKTFDDIHQETSSLQINLLNQAYHRQLERQQKELSIKYDSNDWYSKSRSKSKSNFSKEQTKKQTNLFDSDLELNFYKYLDQNHKMYVLPDEAKLYEHLMDEMNKQLTIDDNVKYASRLFQQLWQRRADNISRLNFFYQMFAFLFQRYLKVKFCYCHQPPCTPTVDSRQFKKFAIPILQQFCQSINPNRNMIVQIELLSAIESLIYNKSNYLSAVGEVFDLLFKSSLVEAYVFVEWSKLDDPSRHFKSVNNPVGSKNYLVRKPKCKSTESVNVLRTFKHLNSNHECQPENNVRVDSIKLITHRNRLISQLYKSGFTLLKKSNSIA